MTKRTSSGTPPGSRTLLRRAGREGAHAQLGALEGLLPSAEVTGLRMLRLCAIYGLFIDEDHALKKKRMKKMDGLHGRLSFTLLPVCVGSDM